ncbi:MAG: (Fe-S)-binding protein [Candidatus Aenigmatarchaeota archaeon]
MGLLNLSGNILFYPGCMMKFVTKKQNENYKKILKKIGLDFIELKELEVCCGSPVLSAGYLKEAKRLAEKNLKTFKEHSVKKIITPCPACFRIFSQEYPKLIKGWDLKVEHIIQTIAKAIDDGKLKLMKRKIKVTFHDPCHLGRYCGIYEEPRKIIISKAELKEMGMVREQSLCCGGGGGVRSNYPELAKEMAKERLKQAEQTRAQILVTSCPLCFVQLKEASENSKIKVVEMSEFINEM